MKKMRFETLAIHAGSEVYSETGAVIAPLHLSTTFERDPSGGYHKGFSYSRSDNPNRRSLECLLAELEGGAEAAAFGSGSAATAAVFRSLRPGDHALIPHMMYHGIRRFLQQAMVPWGLELTAVDMTDIREVEAKVRSTT
jgi:cystathionine gamma-synthase